MEVGEAVGFGVVVSVAPRLLLSVGADVVVVVVGAALPLEHRPFTQAS